MPIDELRQRRTALLEELAKHEAEVTAARENAIEGKVAGVDNAKYVELATRHEIEAGVCAAAISQIDNEIGAIEAKTAPKADRAQREASSRTLNSNTDAIDKTLAPLIDALSNAQAAIEKARPIISDVGIYALFSQLQDQLPFSFE